MKNISFTHYKAICQLKHVDTKLKWHLNDKIDKKYSHIAFEA